jgi:hypothetical protein
MTTTVVTATKSVPSVDVILQAWSAEFVPEPDTITSNFTLGDSKAPYKPTAEELAEQLKASPGTVFATALTMAKNHVRATYQRYLRWDVKEALGPQAQDSPLANRTADLVSELVSTSEQELSRLDLLANALSLANESRERAFLDGLHANLLA